MADTDPAVTLRRAAELAPKVLPQAFADLVVRDADTYCPLLQHGLTEKRVPEAVRRAEAVLALAEQQQAQRQDAVETVDEALAEVRLHIGPNTRSLIADGHWKTMPLSLGERRSIAEIAVAAMKSR